MRSVSYGDARYRTFFVRQLYVGRTLIISFCYHMCCGVPVYLSAESHLTGTARVRPESPYTRMSIVRATRLLLYTLQSMKVLLAAI